MSIRDKLSKPIKKFFLSSLEPTSPVWAGYLLNRKLERLENQGSITSFKFRISRIRKHRYRMELELSLTEKQVKKGFSDMIETLNSLKGGD